MAKVKSGHTTIFLAVLLFAARQSWGIYGPSLTRADSSIAIKACQEAGFSQSQAIGRAMQTKNLKEIKRLLPGALKEWHGTSQASSKYAAESFCIHELVPDSLPRGDDAAQNAKEFQSIGVVYFFYEPDGAYRLKDNPVDLNQLATTSISSPWGQQAFLMMTKLGWSQGECREGSDQFKEVISHGEEFLKKFPDAAVSSDIRFELAKAYATWWNLSLHAADQYVNPKAYAVGAEKARLRAIDLHKYLNKHKVPIDSNLDALEAKSSTDSYDYFCSAYED